MSIQAFCEQHGIEPQTLIDVYNANKSRIKAMLEGEGVVLIAAERARQIEVEGWNDLHDDEHDSMQLSGAAGCYLANAINKAYEGEPHTKKNRARFQYNYDDMWQPVVRKGGWKDGWPWSKDWDKRKKHDQLRSLVIAGALIAAEIDRLQNDKH